MICHGKGDGAIGCCWLGTVVCPHRWRIDDQGGTLSTRDSLIYDADDNLLGTVDAYVKSVHNSKPRQDRVVDVIQGRRFVCGVLANGVVANGIPTGANWEADFEAAWSAAYAPGAVAADTGDYWASIGQPRNWCVSYGPDDNTCCFGETQPVNDAGAATLSATSVTIASRSTLGGG